jgi:PAS domain S-box-containing protein
LSAEADKQKHTSLNTKRSNARRKENDVGRKRLSTGKAASDRGKKKTQGSTAYKLDDLLELVSSGKDYPASPLMELVSNDGEIRRLIEAFRIREERLRSEPELESEELYRTLVNTAQEGIILDDPDDTILFANPTVSALLGYPQDELVGRSLFDFISPDETELLRSQTARRMEGETSRYELTLVHKEGMRHRTLVTAAPLYDSDGKLYASMAILTDITELKRAEEEIKRRSEELRTLLETGTAVSSTLDEKKISQLIASRASDLIRADGCTVYSFDAEARELVPITTTVAAEYQDRMTCRVPLGEGITGKAAVERKPLMANNVHLDPQARGVRGTQKLSTCLLSAPLVAREELLGVMTLVRISEEGFTEHNLQVFALFARQAAEAFANSYLFRKLREFNETLERKVGERTAELERAKGELEEVHLRYKERVTDRLSRIAPAMEKVSVGDFSENIPLPEEEDEFTELIVGLNLMIDDLRFMFEENRRRSEELRQLNENLEQIVAQRTADLEESNRKTAAFARELEEMIYVTSHDLKTPLRAISGFSQFLYVDYNDKLDEEGRLYLTRLIDAVERMEKLLDDLLATSAVSRTERKFERVQAGDLVKEAIKLVNPDENADIVYDPDELPSVSCDRFKMIEVFYNLISNGLKFNDKPHKQIKITARTSEGFWEFMVADNGIGIEKRHYERIFKIFQRLHQRGAYEGTGVGLSMVKRVIEEHNGRIWVESHLGVGTIFHFTLPAQREEDDKAANPERST